MTVLQAAAAVTLWRSRRFDTHDIAGLIGAKECDVLRTLDAVRNAERGPDLHIVNAERAPT